MFSPLLLSIFAFYEMYPVELERMKMLVKFKLNKIVKNTPKGGTVKVYKINRRKA